MHLIVGLGNPGHQYKFTRHNIGFMAIDALAMSYSLGSAKNEHKAETYRFNFDGQQVLLAKPQTFMNLSGQSVVPLLQFYQIPPEKMLVIHDEIDLPYEALRFQTNRGHGGHNGIRNIHELLGHSNYDRLKLGVGRPAGTQKEVRSHVLESFSKDEEKSVAEFLNYTIDALECYLKDGIQKSSSLFNRSAVKEV